MGARTFGSRNFRWQALRAATALLRPLKRRYPFYMNVVPLTEAGDVHWATEQQPNRLPVVGPGRGRRQKRVAHEFDVGALVLNRT